MVAPTFAPSLDSLKASLRLTSVTSGDALAILEDAIREVRLGFVRRLGSPIIVTLQGTAYDPASGPPTTDAEIRREVANLVEIMWVRKLLLERLPTIFRDSSGDTMLAWQNEALTRESNNQLLIEGINRQIEEGFDMLLGDDEPDAATVSATTFEAAPPKVIMGDSVRPFVFGD